MKYEFKFQIPALQSAMIEDWLNLHFIPDPNHPIYEIRSLYYDQLHFEHHNKIRTRLRWYRQNPNEKWDNCFAEVKYRNTLGERSKLRYLIDSNLFTTQTDFCPGNFIASVTGFNQFVGLSPILAFTYSRKRYLARDNNFSFNLDYNLKLDRILTKNVVNHWQLLFSHPSPTILELKTNDSSFVPLLRDHLLNFGKPGFSKYSFFYQSIQELL